MLFHNQTVNDLIELDNLTYQEHELLCRLLTITDLDDITEANSSKQYFAVGLFYQQQKKYEYAMKYYDLVNQTECQDVLFYLGGIYEVGLGVPVDGEKACVFWRRGFDLGNHMCAFGIGLYYTRIHKDALAIKYLSYAFSYRNPGAALILGVIEYKNKNYRLASQYYEFAYNNGNLHAAIALGYQYKDQPECRNFDKAAGYFLQSYIETGNNNAKKELINLYKKGLINIKYMEIFHPDEYG